MKRQLISFFILSFFILGLTNFSSHISIEEANSEINDRHKLRLDDLLSSAIEYQKIARSNNKSKLLEKHVSCRNSYKRAEHLLNYWDRSFLKLNINGAPLPVVTTENKSVVVQEPEGLQVLDELLFEDKLDYSTIQAKVDKLVENIRIIYPHERKRTFDDKSILEGIRNQLIRIMTLSITGFDTPGSLNGLDEAQVSLDAIQCDLESYMNVVNSESEPIINKCVSLISGARQYIIDNNDFDTLSRTELIRTYLDPLYASILDFHKAQGIRIKSKESELDKSVMYNSTSLFSEELLNPYYYTGLKENDDNDLIRELGSYLFYDQALSSANNLSCASCHSPEKAFTDGLKKSISAHGNRTVLRNSPTLINSIYSSRFFYDLRAKRLETQVLDVINSSEEFNIDINTIVSKLETSDEYRTMFSKAFEHIGWESETISSYKIVAALSSYVLSLRSQNSPLDRYMRRETTAISSSVREGFDLFMGKAACATCHFPPHFNGLVPDEYHENETEVLGVPIDGTNQELDTDIGRIGNGWPHEEAEHYRFSFKTTGLRNIELTAPYMHNGAFETLEEVISFYDKGGGAGHGLEVPFQTLSADPLNLTETEKVALVSFMESLTDTSFQKSVPVHLPSFQGDLSNLNREVKY